MELYAFQYVFPFFVCFLFLSLPSVLSAHLCARLATNFKLFNVSIVRLV